MALKNHKPYGLSLRWVGSNMQCIVTTPMPDRELFWFELSDKLKQDFETELDKAIDKNGLRKHKNKIPR